MSGSSRGRSKVGVRDCIIHNVSKLDTLAGVAIRYGVEVGDIKRMNGLATDLQMFALKSLQIPLPGRHLPSPSHNVSNGTTSQGEIRSEKEESHVCHANMLQSLQSLSLRPPAHPQSNVSPAMTTLQNFYGLKPPRQKGTTEGTEMTVYRMEMSESQSRYLDDNHKPRNVADNNGDVARDVPVAEAGEGADGERSSEKSIRRRSKAEAADWGFSKDDNGNNGFLRPKSVSRSAVVAAAADASESGLVGMLSNPIIAVGLGDSLMADDGPGPTFATVHKSSSTSSLQVQDLTSKWSLKPDLQALSNAAIGRRNKAALD